VGAAFALSPPAAAGSLARSLLKVTSMQA